jgi:hypothetical protein
MSCLPDFSITARFTEPLRKRNVAHAHRSFDGLVGVPQAVPRLAKPKREMFIEEIIPSELI